MPVGNANGQKAHNDSPPVVERLPDEADVDDVLAERHNVSLSFMEEPPGEIVTGSEMVLTLCVKCPSGCDLVGHTLAIRGQEGVVIDGLELVEFDGTANKTAPFTVQVPEGLGEYTWTAVFPVLEEEDIIHEESTHAFSFTVQPHPTSMAVWDVDSPIIAGRDFEITVGVKCGLHCNLANQKVAVYDQDGNAVAAGELGDALYSSSIDLYWTVLKLKAPEKTGSFTWEAKFPRPDHGIPHDECGLSFSFSTTPPPDCEVTVRVMDKETGDPIGNAQVTMRPNLYTDFTDEQGEARIGVPRGEYKVSISAARPAPRGIDYKWGEVPRVTRGHEYIVYVPPENKETLANFEATYQIDEDTTIEVELVGIIEPPEEDTL